MNIFLLSFDSDIKLIFVWWLEQFSKLINLMKHIPIFGKTITLYHVIIALIVIRILIAIIKYNDHLKASHKPNGANNDDYLSFHNDIFYDRRLK